MSYSIQFPYKAEKNAKLINGNLLDSQPLRDYFSNIELQRNQIVVDEIQKLLAEQEFTEAGEFFNDLKVSLDKRDMILTDLINIMADQHLISGAKQFLNATRLTAIEKQIILKKVVANLIKKAELAAAKELLAA